MAKELNGAQQLPRTSEATAILNCADQSVGSAKHGVIHYADSEKPNGKRVAVRRAGRIAWYSHRKLM